MYSLFPILPRREFMKYINSITRAVVSAFAIFAIAMPVSAQDNNTKLGLHTVMIDPGHGGKDPGCVSADRKTYEKQIALDVSKKLQQKITEGYPDVTAKMTRESDNVFVELNNRAKSASNAGADLFISIHVNAQAKGTSANGFSIHILGQSSDKNTDTYAFNMEVCKRENEVIYLEEDYSTTYQGLDNDAGSAIILNLMANAYREQSLLFAQDLNEKFIAEGPIKKSNGVMQNNFAVLRLASMPAVLIELGFMTNPNDLAAMRKSENIDKFAQAIFDAFVQYKTRYDESMGIQVTAPRSQEEIEAEKAAEQEDNSIRYGVQIFTSSKVIKAGDSQLMGYPHIAARYGNTFRYIIGSFSSADEAKKELPKIRKKYPQAFLVQIDGEKISRY